MKNIRLKHGASQRHIAQLAGMSAQAVMRYEQGLYENLSPSLAIVLAELDQRPVGEVIALYDQMREDIQTSANLTVIPPLTLQKGEHPFESFEGSVLRFKGLDVSRIGFCKLLALHPATVAEYDSGRVRSMPALIERGLRNAGMDIELIETLDTFGELWYERHG